MSCGNYICLIFGHYIMLTTFTLIPHITPHHTVIAAAKHMVSDALLAELQTAVDALQGTDAATGKDYIATAKKVHCICLCFNIFSRQLT